MIHKKLHALYEKHLLFGYVLTAATLVVALLGIIGVWAVNRYWHPPLLQFSESDIARTVTFDTNYGSFTIELDRRAIFPAAHFTQLVVDGFYKDTKFHRVVPDLLIEGGDPLSRDTSLRYLWGQGGLGNAFKNEIHDYDVMSEGTVAFSSSGANTFGSQFFIVTKDTTWLKGKHTIFGHVTKGFDVIHTIERVPLLPTGLPIDDVIITNIVVNE